MALGSLWWAGICDGKPGAGNSIRTREDCFGWRLRYGEDEMDGELQWGSEGRVVYDCRWKIEALLGRGRSRRKIVQS
jgi:hypothetical protein